MVPRIFKYAGENTNATHVTIGNLDLYYSYTTVIAFSVDGVLKVHKNIWRKTTTMHMKAIPGYATGTILIADDFQNALREATNKF